MYKYQNMRKNPVPPEQGYIFTVIYKLEDQEIRRNIWRFFPKLVDITEIK